MTLAVFIDKINACLEKAFLDESWLITTDEDEICDIFIVRQGRIYIDDTLFTHTVEDAVRIKYAIDEVNGRYCIVISFTDGTALEIGNKDEKKYAKTYTVDGRIELN